MEYKIIGEPMPVVICYLEPNESMITERGSMVWMSENMQMDTKGTSLSKAIGRIFTNESIFQNIYTARGGRGMIAFASSFPGSIKQIDVTPSNPVIVQKSAFLASQPGIELSTYFQKKLSSGLFSGEGFIMQKLSGNGKAFLEIDGTAVKYTLKPGESLVVDSGNLAMMDASCSLDIQTIRGVKNVLFGGEGLFNTIVHGPGDVILQTMPISNTAAAIAPYIMPKGDH